MPFAPPSCINQTWPYILHNTQFNTCASCVYCGGWEPLSIKIFKSYLFLPLTLFFTAMVGKVEKRWTTWLKKHYVPHCGVSEPQCANTCRWEGALKIKTMVYRQTFLPNLENIIYSAIKRQEISLKYNFPSSKPNCLIKTLASIYV